MRMEEARWRRYAGRSMREAARRLVARALEAHEALLEDVWRRGSLAYTWQERSGMHS